jgi:hypothetical protein
LPEIVLMTSRFILLIIGPVLFIVAVLFVPLLDIFGGTNGEWIAWTALLVFGFIAFLRSWRFWKPLFFGDVGENGEGSEEERAWRLLTSNEKETAWGAALLLWMKGGHARSRLTQVPWESLHPEVRANLLELAALEQDETFREHADGEVRRSGPVHEQAARYLSVLRRGAS